MANGVAVVSVSPTLIPRPLMTTLCTASVVFTAVAITDPVATLVSVQRLISASLGFTLANARGCCRGLWGALVTYLAVYHGPQNRVYLDTRGSYVPSVSPLDNLATLVPYERSHVIVAGVPSELPSYMGGLTTKGPLKKALASMFRAA